MSHDDFLKFIVKINLPQKANLLIIYKKRIGLLGKSIKTVAGNVDIPFDWKIRISNNQKGTRL